MYLSDSRIKEILHELNFETASNDTEFSEDEQIQPCTIDLRLCSVFWKPLKRQTIDLRKSRLLEIKPRRNYRRFELKPGEHYTIRPGQMLLGRIHEQFSMPNGYAGEITGRSSFARLGLMIHCTGGFINPGWRGHMPLQLVNMSRNSIKVFPHLPICQLKIAIVDGEHERLYGEQELQSKYMDDDGGPSYWWRDKRIKQLHTSLENVDVSLEIQRELLDIIGNQEPEIIERLEKQISKSRLEQLENTDVILERFTKSEDKRRKLRKGFRGLGLLTFPAILAISLRVWFTDPFNWIDYLFIIFALIGLIISFIAYGWSVGEHFGNNEWRKS